MATATKEDKGKAPPSAGFRMIPGEIRMKIYEGIFSGNLPICPRRVLKESSSIYDNLAIQLKECNLGIQDPLTFHFRHEESATGNDRAAPDTEIGVTGEFIFQQQMALVKADPSLWGEMKLAFYQFNTFDFGHEGHHLRDFLMMVKAQGFLHRLREVTFSIPEWTSFGSTKNSFPGFALVDAFKMLAEAGSRKVDGAQLATPLLSLELVSAFAPDPADADTCGVYFHYTAWLLNAVSKHVQLSFLLPEGGKICLCTCDRGAKPTIDLLWRGNGDEIPGDLISLDAATLYKPANRDTSSFKDLGSTLSAPYDTLKQGGAMEPWASHLASAYRDIWTEHFDAVTAGRISNTVDARAEHKMQTLMQQQVPQELFHPHGRDGLPGMKKDTFFDVFAKKF